MFGRVYAATQFSSGPVQRDVRLDYYRPAKAKELYKAHVNDIA